MDLKISVVMPIFNRGSSVKDSILSVLNQDYSNFELIVIDDGSTENLEQMIRQLDNSRIQYHRLSRNAGQSYARNVGVSLSNGDVIAFQDSDDLWVPGRMRKQIEFMEESDFSFCAFDKGSNRYPNFSIDVDQLYDVILSTPTIGTPTLFCKREVFEKIGGFNETYRCFEDYDLSLRLSKNYKGKYLDEVLLIVRESEEHVGGDENANEGLRVRCELFQRYYRDICEKHLEQKWLDGIYRFKRVCDSVVFSYEIEKVRLFLSEMQEKNGFLSVDTAKYVRDILSQAVEMGVDFKLNGPALGQRSFNQKDLKIRPEGMDCEKLLAFFRNTVIPSCTNFANEGFLGFPDAGNSIGGLLGAVFSDFMQQNLINESFCAPIATHMEIAVIQSLRQLAGFSVKENVEKIEDAGGVITYGGTGSNCIAMLLAREHKAQHTLNNGVRQPEKFSVIIPKGIGHYSIRSSLRWLGCGEQIIEVETKEYRYDLEALRKKLQENHDNVMAVVAYAGDSRTMTIEYLDELERVVHEINPRIWCHVDACHGFSLLFCESLKDKMKGIEKYDSISFDPHKVMAIPYCCSALLLKNPDSFQYIVSESDLIMKENLAFGKITPFIGSKSWVSLKMWFVMQNLGIKGLGQMIRHRTDMAQYFKTKLEESGNFSVLNSVDFNSVVFLWNGSEQNLPIECLNRISQKMYKKIRRDGRYYFHQFPIKAELQGKLEGENCVPLRYMSGNMNLTTEILDDAIGYLEKLGEECFYEVCT